MTAKLSTAILKQTRNNKMGVVKIVKGNEMLFCFNFAKANQLTMYYTQCVSFDFPRSYFRIQNEIGGT